MADKSLILFEKNGYCLRSYNPKNRELGEFHNGKTDIFKDDFTTAVLDSYLYILSSNKSVHRLNIIQKNPKWERMQDMISDHGSWPPVIPFGGSLFVIGASGVEPIKDVEEYDPSSNTWVGLKDRMKAVGDVALVTLNDSIYSIGGWHKDKETNEFFSFTPSSSEWLQLEPMKQRRHYCGAVVVDDKIFVIAGCDESVAIDVVECYDVISSQWTSLTSTIDPHEFNRAYHINGWIYTVSLYEKASEMEKYDIANDKWYRVDLEGGGFEISGSVAFQLTDRKM